MSAARSKYRLRPGRLLESPGAADRSRRDIAAPVVALLRHRPVEIIRRVVSELQPGDIVVLHDGRPPNEPPDRSSTTRDETVTAVGLILEEMTARGLRSVTITELLASP